MAFDCNNGANNQVLSVHARINGKPKPFEIAVKLQELVVKACESKETTPSALAQLARAWDVLEERKRVIKMKPAPKPIEVRVRTRGKRIALASNFSETPANAPQLPQDKPKASAG